MTEILQEIAKPNTRSCRCGTSFSGSHAMDREERLKLKDDDEKLTRDERLRIT